MVDREATRDTLLHAEREKDARLETVRNAVEEELGETAMDAVVTLLGLIMLGVGLAEVLPPPLLGEPVDTPERVPGEEVGIHTEVTLTVTQRELVGVLEGVLAFTEGEGEGVAVVVGVEVVQEVPRPLGVEVEVGVTVRVSPLFPPVALGIRVGPGVRVPRGVLEAGEEGVEVRLPPNRVEDIAGEEEEEGEGAPEKDTLVVRVAANTVGDAWEDRVGFMPEGDGEAG